MKSNHFHWIKWDYNRNFVPYISSSSCGGSLNSLITVIQCQYSPLAYWFSNHPDAMLANVFRSESCTVFWLANCIAMFCPTNRYLSAKITLCYRMCILDLVFFLFQARKNEISILNSLPVLAQASLSNSHLLAFSSANLDISSSHFIDAIRTAGS